MRIGFPRAVNFFDFYPYWAGFFRSLAIELVPSPATNRKIMELGLKAATDDTCLPIKLLAGHVQALGRVDNVDAVFLPRLVSVEEDTYMCPKILGIPESVQGAVPSGMPVLSVTINRRRQKGEVVKALNMLGQRLGKGTSQVRTAIAVAERWQNTFEHLRRGGYDFAEAVDRVTQQDGGQVIDMRTQQPVDDFVNQTEVRPTIALVGHSYLVNESYANLNLLTKLRAKADVRLVENVSRREAEHSLRGLRKKVFWSHAKRILGAGHSFAGGAEVDGIIYLSCFACGTDSMTQDLLARQARQNHKPYMVLTLDEHSGEAGLVTRMEAFLDMIERRTECESNLPTYGKRLDRHSDAL